jgi:ribosome-binding protein aMBF1 (putative translation factor)
MINENKNEKSKEKCRLKIRRTYMINAEQDWKVISWDKRGQKHKDETKTQQLERVKRDGSASVTTKTKLSQANKSILGSTSTTTLKKIENETETFKLPSVSKTMAKKIATARCLKKMSQKDLAMKLNLPFKIIKDYESGIAIPNHLIINKIEAILETRVRD